MTIWKYWVSIKHDTQGLGESCEILVSFNGNSNSKTGFGRSCVWDRKISMALKISEVSLLELNFVKLSLNHIKQQVWETDYWKVSLWICSFLGDSNKHISWGERRGNDWNRFKREYREEWDSKNRQRINWYREIINSFKFWVCRIWSIMWQRKGTQSSFSSRQNSLYWFLAKLSCLTVHSIDSLTNLKLSDLPHQSINLAFQKQSSRGWGSDVPS